MGLESASYVNQLIATNPTGSDPKSQGDDHLRLLKSVLLATFPNLGAPVTPTAAQLNTVPNLAPLASPSFTGVPLVPLAPSNGWAVGQVASCDWVTAALASAAATAGLSTTTPTANAVPRANAAGTIDHGWIGQCSQLAKQAIYNS